MANAITAIAYLKKQANIFTRKVKIYCKYSSYRNA